jgi:hypothetical protein
MEREDYNFLVCLHMPSSSIRESTVFHYYSKQMAIDMLVNQCSVYGIDTEDLDLKELWAELSDGASIYIIDLQSELTEKEFKTFENEIFDWVKSETLENYIEFLGFDIEGLKKELSNLAEKAEERDRED